MIGLIITKGLLKMDLATTIILAKECDVRSYNLWIKPKMCSGEHKRQTRQIHASKDRNKERTIF